MTRAAVVEKLLTKLTVSTAKEKREYKHSSGTPSICQKLNPV
jgi:hypothetical protein